MKKILAIVLTVLLIVPFAAFPAFAEEACPEEETAAAEPMEEETAGKDEEEAETLTEQPVRSAESGDPDGNAPPEITVQPRDITIEPDVYVSFTARASGDGLSYRWQVSKDGGTTWKNCTSTGYATDTLSFRTRLSYSGWMYRCRISNPAGETVSDTALLTVEQDPLVFHNQPQDADVRDGEMAAFQAQTFRLDVTYQWQVSKDGGTTWRDCISRGYDTDTFIFTAKASYSGWKYRCRATDGTRTIVSDTATLTVTALGPAVTKQPEDIRVPAQTAVAFRVKADGTNLTYRWQVSKDGGTTWKNCTSTGYATDTLSFTAKLSYSGWMYRCRISNSLGSLVTDTAVLTVSSEAPAIAVQPRSCTVVRNETASFTCEAAGSGCSCRWQVSKDGGTTWKNCTSTGYDTDTLSFTAKLSYSGWMYRCRVTGDAGTAYSDTAVLTVVSTAPPAIVSALEDRTVSEGLNAHITVRAEGEELSYRWQVSKNGGATWKNCTSTGCATDTLSFTARLSYSGWMYRCVVSNPGGEEISREMVLTVQEPDGRTKNTAFAMRSGESCRMTLDHGGDCYLQFTLPERGVFAFWMTKPLYQGEPVNFELTVSRAYETETCWIAHTSSQKDLPGENYSCAVGLDAGVYVIDLRAFQTDLPDTMEFGFGYTFTASGSWEIEDNNFPNCANGIVLGETVHGMLGDTSVSPADDWYTLELQKGQRYALILDNIEALNGIGAELAFFRMTINMEIPLITEVRQVDTALVAVLEPDWTDDYCIGIKGTSMQPGVPYELTVIPYGG